MPSSGKFDMKKVTVKLVDGTTPTANEIEIKFDDGNFTWGENYNVDVILDRGQLDTLRDGDEQPMDITFGGRFDNVKSTTGDPFTLSEFLKNRGPTALTSTITGDCGSFTTDIVALNVPSCTIGGTVVENETLTFTQFFAQQIGGDFQAGQLNVSGICNSQFPIGVRSAPA